MSAAEAIGAEISEPLTRAEICARDPDEWVVIAAMDDSLAEAIRRLTMGPRRHLPVVDERRLRGVISIRDILVDIAARFPGEMTKLPPDPTHKS